MANPNPQIWGNTESWIYAPQAYGLQTETAEQGNYAKPKVNNFDDTLTAAFKGSLYGAITSGKMTLNNFIDDTICPCGQDPNVSPWGRIAVFNENNDFSLTPSSVHTFTDQNINWFFADRASNIPVIEGYAFDKNYEGSYPRGLEYQQFAPKAIDPVSANNVNFQLIPYVYYGIKSLVLSIEVGLIPKNSTYVNNRIWTTLDGWKNTYKDTYDMCSLRLFVRNCLSYNSNNFTYNNDKAISTGKASYICVTNKVAIENDGEKIPTQFFDRFNPNLNERCVYIFDNTSAVWNQGAFHTRGFLPCWDYFTGQSVKKYEQGNPPDQCIYFYMIPYSDDTYNKCLSIAALFGCFFTPSNKYSFGDTMTDDDLYLSIIDENGVTHGDYTKGADNVNNPLYEKNSVRDFDYDPTKPPAPVDPNTYNNTTVFNVIGAGASMNKRYLLDAANVAKLSTDLFDICDDMSTGSDYSFFDSKVKANMLTQSPIDSIVSLIRYPFTPTHGSTKQSVKLGRFTASAEGYPIVNAIQTITFAGVDIFPRFGNNFLDYEPYTKYEVYVPFCDTVELSAADILGHRLNVRLVVDLFTGVCTGYILADSLCIETTTGNVGVSLPLTGLDTATINANIANAEANKKAAKKNYIKGHFDIITQKDKVGAIWTQILGTNEDVVKKADYDLKHIETPMHTIGAASPLSSWAMDLNARVIIYYPTGDAITNDTPPKLRNLSTYAHTTGFATIDNSVLSNYSGFTVATNAILNFAATTTEKDMIESALNGGIFI